MELIALAVYGKNIPPSKGYGFYDRMESLGWIKIYDDFLAQVGQDLTQPQVDKLGELMALEDQLESLVSSIRNTLAK